MRYLRAIISTTLVLFTPIIILPLLQWYKRECLEPNTEIWWVYFLLVIMSLSQIVLCLFMWVSAFSDKDIKDIINE